jgi:hypothetical protein
MLTPRISENRKQDAYATLRPRLDDRLGMAVAAENHQQVRDKLGSLLRIELSFFSCTGTVVSPVVGESVRHCFKTRVQG